jgi:hypothetical protein
MKRRHLIGVISCIAGWSLLLVPIALADVPVADPKQVAVHPDSPIKNSPRYILSGTTEPDRERFDQAAGLVPPSGL